MEVNVIVFVGDTESCTTEEEDSSGILGRHSPTQDPGTAFWTDNAQPTDAPEVGTLSESEVQLRDGGQTDLGPVWGGGEGSNMHVDDSDGPQAADAPDPSEGPTTSTEDGGGYANIVAVGVCVAHPYGCFGSERTTVSSTLCNVEDRSVSHSVVHTRRISECVARTLE